MNRRGFFQRMLVAAGAGVLVRPAAPLVADFPWKAHTVMYAIDRATFSFVRNRYAVIAANARPLCRQCGDLYATAGSALCSNCDPFDEYRDVRV